MTRAQWARIAALIDNLWSSPAMTEEREEAYWFVLAHHDADGVLYAVRQLAGEDRAFTPSAGEIAARVPAPLSYDRAWRWRRARGGWPQEELERAARAHPRLLAWIRESAQAPEERWRDAWEQQHQLTEGGTT